MNVDQNDKKGGAERREERKEMKLSAHICKMSLQQTICMSDVTAHEAYQVDNAIFIY